MCHNYLMGVVIVQTLPPLRWCCWPMAFWRPRFSLRGALLALACVIGLVAAAFGFAQNQAGGTTDEASYSEVQAFIERFTVEGFPLDEVVSSALELGYKPELVAAVLASQKIDPVTVAVVLVNEGVARDVAAAAVIAVSDPVVAPAVKAAVSVGASETETKAIEAVTPTPKTEPAPTPAATEPVQPAETPAATEPAPAPETPPAEPLPPAAPVPVPEPTPEPAAPAPQPVPEPVAPVPPIVTPPIMGGGGGSTRN